MNCSLRTFTGVLVALLILTGCSGGEEPAAVTPPPVVETVPEPEIQNDTYDEEIIEVVSSEPEPAAPEVVPIEPLELTESVDSDYDSPEVEIDETAEEALFRSRITKIISVVTVPYNDVGHKIVEKFEVIDCETLEFGAPRLCANQAVRAAGYDAKYFQDSCRGVSEDSNEVECSYFYTENI